MRVRITVDKTINVNGLCLLVSILICVLLQLSEITRLVDRKFMCAKEAQVITNA